MHDKLYDMIFKRKSFHLFRNIGNEHITEEELKDIEEEFNKLKPLVAGINVLQNIGYLGEQLDLYLVSKNIGTLWFGIGKPEEKRYEGLDFVIMIAIAKIDSEDKFRKDMFKSKRKNLEEIWNGDYYLDIANIVRFAPSACNTQPWVVDASKNELKVYRYRKEGKRGIMPIDMVKYYNQIDIGIFLCFIDLCLNKNNLKYEGTLYIEENTDNEKYLTATYKIN